MTTPYLATLLSRFKSEWTGDAKFKSSYAALLRALELAEVAATKRDEIAKPGHLSAEGITKKLRKFFAETLISDLARARVLLEKDEAALAARREKFAIPVPDQNVVPAAIRQEWREMMRGMEVFDRIALVLDPKNVLAIEAAFEGGPILSGVPADVLKKVEGGMIHALHGPEIAVVADEAEALTIRRMVLDYAIGQVRVHGDFPETGAAFDTFVEQNSAAALRQVQANPAPPAPAAATQASEGLTYDEKIAAINATYAATLDTIFGKAAAA